VISLSLLPSPSSPLNFSSYFFVFSSHIWNKICEICLQYLGYFVNMVSVSIHFPIDDMISFFFMAEKYSIMYVHHIFFMHLSVNGHIVYFCTWLLWVVLQWTWICRCFHCVLTSFPSGVHLGVW
jgi:hypothetical protein